ncbi:hypothetical protein Tco_0958827 [Tanacetum coccineum]
MIGTPKKENLDRYCDYHRDKGHYTNDCYQLKRQLEATLESGKLSHLVKDVRQQGNARGRQPGNYNGKDKVINMLWERGDSRKWKVELEVTFISEGLCRRMMMKFTVRLEKRKVEQEGKSKEVESDRRKESAKEEILVNPVFLEQKVTIGTQFSKECRLQLINLLNDTEKKSFGHREEPSSNELGRNLKACIDDMVIKSKTEQEMIMDIAETFDNIQRVNMKLNPKKCSFGIGEGKFLGYMVTSEGIRENPKKTKVVADMQSLKTLKEMQSLSEKLAAINCFLA